MSASIRFYRLVEVLPSCKSGCINGPGLTGPKLRSNSEEAGTSGLGVRGDALVMLPLAHATRDEGIISASMARKTF